MKNPQKFGYLCRQPFSVQKSKGLQALSASLFLRKRNSVNSVAKLDSDILFLILQQEQYLCNKNTIDELFCTRICKTRA